MLEWNEIEIELAQIRPYERNPRTITEAQLRKLRESIEQDGYHSRIKLTDDFRLVGGHQRLKVLRELGFDKVRALVPSRKLSDEEFQRILIRDNHNNGVFDMEELANAFDLEFLRDIGLHEVMNVAPEGEEEPPKGGGRMMKCPCCGETFPAKGNTAKE